MNTEIIVIMDRSGSMKSTEADAVGGFNTLLEDQRAVPGNARMTFVTFSDYSQTTFEGVDLALVAPIRGIRPSGMTALLDCIGQTLNVQGRRIALEGWADKVIVAIITDGEENSSRMFTRPAIKQMIEHAQEHGWSFIFLGANINAEAVGTSYGIDQSHIYGYTASAAGTQVAMRQMSAATRQLRGTSF